MKFVLIFIFLVTFVTYIQAADYQWGEPDGPKDYLIAKDKVKKIFFLGLRVTKKYIFKQRDTDALTITAIRITDIKKKYDSTAEIISGGLGSKGVAIRFKSKKSKSIKSLVEIWGR
ncbi:uncharacterized protein LOC129949175 [Eupeodes corollae]|uniref:uncharacterized protein LOC129949175 n=1 Tax=Eupeodes corollae TaxID=290404 RepID=UPI0024933B73|nr:uncharacterized protein LOC129949175 [Eupeodes corollae]